MVTVLEQINELKKTEPFLQVNSNDKPCAKDAIKLLVGEMNHKQ